MLDPFCRTHDVENLFVVDASFFPSSAAVNPGLTIAAQALRVADHIKATDLGTETYMKARSFSHSGITVSDFNRAVQFYWDVFGCPLVGVADTPPDRVRTFFGVDGRRSRSCKIGWIRVPGGAVLEIFEFQPQLPPRRGAVEPRRPDAHLASTSATCRSGTTTWSSKGVECVSQPERSPRGHSFFFAKDFDGNLIELMDLGYMYYVLGVARPARRLDLPARDVQEVLRVTSVLCRTARGASRKAMSDASADCLTGNQALQRGAWAEARAAFEAALEIHESPEALEGLGLAAWWLDLADVVFEARERAYRLYLSRDDEAAPHASLSAGWDCWAFRGENAVANGWLQRARRLLDGIRDCAERAWLELREGALAPASRTAIPIARTPTPPKASGSQRPQAAPISRCSDARCRVWRSWRPARSPKACACSTRSTRPSSPAR